MSAGRRSTADARQTLADCQRIVIKVGSALLAQSQGKLFRDLAAQVNRLRQQKRQVVLVSSGAIAFGLSTLGLKRRPHRLGTLQAAAAVGQIELSNQWAKSFGRHQIPVAQILLTHADLENRERFLNTRHTLHELLKRNVIPIANENDTVATDEIRVGDNDQLSAHLASAVRADLLVLLTTVDGLFDKNPSRHRGANRVPIVHRFRDVAHAAESAATDSLGTGGMVTKLSAARSAVNHGIPVVIAHGAEPRVVNRLLAGEDLGTLFQPKKNLRSRKHWIGFTLKPRGILHVDAGAARAVVEQGKSLLPSGLTRVEGHFQRGAMVEIVGPKGVLARGLSAYRSDDLKLLGGHNSREIEGIIGYVDTPEIVHRDDMVILETERSE